MVRRLSRRRRRRCCMCVMWPSAGSPATNQRRWRGSRRVDAPARRQHRNPRQSLRPRPCSEDNRSRETRSRRHRRQTMAQRVAAARSAVSEPMPRRNIAVVTPATANYAPLIASAARMERARRKSAAIAIVPDAATAATAAPTTAIAVTSTLAFVVTAAAAAVAADAAPIRSERCMARRRWSLPCGSYRRRPVPPRPSCRRSYSAARRGRAVQWRGRIACPGTSTHSAHSSRRL